MRIVGKAGGSGAMRHGAGLGVQRLGARRFAGIGGAVVAVGPGLCRAGYGGVRLEDIVLVTETGADVLTDYPYDLSP